MGSMEKGSYLSAITKLFNHNLSNHFSKLLKSNFAIFFNIPIFLQTNNYLVRNKLFIILRILLI